MSSIQINSAGRRNLDASGRVILAGSGVPCCCRAYRIDLACCDTNFSSGGFATLIYPPAPARRFMGDNYTSYGLSAGVMYVVAAEVATGSYTLIDIDPADLFSGPLPPSRPSAVTVSGFDSSFFGTFPLASNWPGEFDRCLPENDDQEVDGLFTFTGGCNYTTNTWAAGYYVYGGPDGTTKIRTPGASTMLFLANSGGQCYWHLQFGAACMEDGSNNLWTGRKYTNLHTPIGVYTKVSGGSSRATVEII